MLGVRAGCGPTVLEEQPQVGVCSVVDRHLHVNGIPKQLHHWVVTGSVVGFIALIYKSPKGVEAIKPELGTSILPETEHIHPNTSSRSYYWVILLMPREELVLETVGQKLQPSGSYLWQS